MQGIDYAVTDAVQDPATPYDDRASVPELLKEHATKIEKMKTALTSDPLYAADKHDDLWILRFLLSHKGKMKKALPAAKHTLLFRKKHNLDDRDIRFHAPHKCQEEDISFAGVPSLKRPWTTRCPDDTIVYAIPDKNRGVVGFIKFAKMKNDQTTLDALTDKDLAAAFIFISEWTFQWLDYVTRTSGRLTKSVRFLDFQGASLFSNQRNAIKRDGKIMDEMEDVYPQLLHAIFIHNAPSWIHTVWAVVRPIMPKRIIEKVDIVEPKTNEMEKKRIFKFLSVENMPVTIGGDNTVAPISW